MCLALTTRSFWLSAISTRTINIFLNITKRARTALTHDKLLQKTPIHMNGSFVFLGRCFLEAFWSLLEALDQASLTQLDRAKEQRRQQ